MQHERRNTHLHSQRILASSFAIGLVCLLMLLAACGTNGKSTTTTGSSGTTQAPAATQATQRNCGVVHTMHLLIVPADVNHAKGVEDCFWQAFQQCAPATMIYSQNSLDTGTIHNFSIKNVNGKCTITDGVQHFIAPHPARSMTTYTCAGVTQQTEGLRFISCGEAGNVLVPSVGAQ